MKALKALALTGIVVALPALGASRGAPWWLGTGMVFPSASFMPTANPSTLSLNVSPVVGAFWRQSFYGGTAAWGNGTLGIGATYASTDVGTTTSDVITGGAAFGTKSLSMGLNYAMASMAGVTNSTSTINAAFAYRTDGLAVSAVVNDLSDSRGATYGVGYLSDDFQVELNLSPASGFIDFSSHTMDVGAAFYFDMFGVGGTLHRTKVSDVNGAAVGASTSFSGMVGVAQKDLKVAVSYEFSDAVAAEGTIGFQGSITF